MKAIKQRGIAALYFSNADIEIYENIRGDLHTCLWSRRVQKSLVSRI